MCGRYSLGLSHADIQALHGYNVEVGEWVGQDQFVPRHNVAPRSQAPVLRRREPAEASAYDMPILHTMKWGLIPHWSKHEDKTLNTTNARSENLVEGGGMWASIRGRRRCAVICEGYFEWLKKGKERLPHFTRHEDGKLMILAGLYDCVVLKGESLPLWTFTIATTAANEQFKWLHDRQPVILSSATALNTWLDTSARIWSPELTELVKPYHDADSRLVCYQVPKEVGKVGTESPTFIQPIAQRKDGIQAMFARQKEASSSKITNVAKKRRRSSSPPSIVQQERSSHAGTPRVEKLNAWNDNSDVEYIDDSSLNEPGSTGLIEVSTLNQGSPKRSRILQGTSKVHVP